MKPPTGNITFLFTDIEGSTRLAQKYPGKYQQAMLRHHEILEEVLSVNNGFIFEIIGDAFCAAFASPVDALKASVNIQEQLIREDWSIPEIRIRIGLHKGDAQWCGERYSGYLTLARVNRIMSVAYGGQILISQGVYESAKQTAGISFKDLGERKLKDLYNPEHIYQVIAEGLYSEFPPLKTLDVRPNNLPLQLTSFVGREDEISQTKNLLNGSRLVTLTGPGGSGKTRLSLQIGADVIDEYTNGVWFAELASVSDPQFIPEAIAHSLSVPNDPSKTADETLSAYLKDKDLLIILDNCEHLIHECSNVVMNILSNSAKVKVIASSREPLQIPGEVVYHVASLTMPAEAKGITAEEALNYESIRLFTDRANLARRDFSLTDRNAETIARLCSEIDGIPLAIELAAARMRVMSAEQILGNICDMFRILTGGSRTALPKQQTLRATIDWSYNLLSENERKLFRQFSVFSGGGEFEALEFVCRNTVSDRFELLDLLTNLIDKSLLKSVHENDSARYSMLQSIKLYAAEKLLESGESHSAKKAHFEYFMNISTDAKSGLTGPEQSMWIARLNIESENLRTALRWAKRSEPLRALSLIVSLGIYYSISGNFREGLDHIRSIMNENVIEDTVMKGTAIFWKGFFLMHLGDHDGAAENFEESADLLRISDNLADVANSLNYLGIIKLYKGDLDAAHKLQNECLDIRIALNDERGVAASYNSLGLYAYKRGEHEESMNYLKKSIDIYRKFNDKRSISASLANLAKMSTALGRYEEAFNDFRECLKISDELGDKYVSAHIIEGVATLFLKQERYLEACRLFALSHKLFEHIGVELRGDELLAFERALPLLREKLGKKIFDGIWQEEQSTDSDNIVIRSSEIIC